MFQRITLTFTRDSASVSSSKVGPYKQSRLLKCLETNFMNPKITQKQVSKEMSSEFWIQKWKDVQMI